MVPVNPKKFCFFLTAFFLCEAFPLRAQVVTAPVGDAVALQKGLQQIMDPPGRTMPADAAIMDQWVRYDEGSLLEARLKASSTPAQLGLDANWEQRQIYRGAGFFIAYTLMINFWHQANLALEQDRPPLQEDAALFLLVSLDYVMADGTKCLDTTAPGHRFQQVVSENTQVVRYLSSLPLAERMEVGSVSLRIEAATAPLRRNDVVLCSDGLAENRASLAQQHGPLQQVPSPPGMVGKTYLLQPPAGYRPQFLDPNQWQPKQAQTQAALPGFLTQLLAAH